MTEAAGGGRFDVAILGAGAAGLMTAITAARRGPGLRVALVDGARKPGAKILISGGGRCNVTNARVLPSDFHGDRRVIARVLRRFDEAATARFFRDLGVELKCEPEYGKIFPVSNRAGDVLQALLAASAQTGVEMVAGFRVAEVLREGDSFTLRASDGRELRAAQLVLATGGQSLPKSGSDGAGYALARALGHSVTATHPALVALVLEPHPFKDLSGVSFPAAIETWGGGRRIAAATGSVLITHFGLSGPAALDVSRHWTTASEPRPELRLNLFPGRERAEIERDWIAAATAPGTRRVASLLEQFPARLARTLVAHAGLSPELALSGLRREARGALLDTVTALTLPITDTRGFREAEVTAGGVPLGEIDPGRMASRACPGLYLVGEILDVDGRIGGFNFQWAWSSGFVVGEALAEAVRTPRPAASRRC